MPLMNKVYYPDDEIRPLIELPERFMDMFGGLPAGTKFYVSDAQMRQILAAEEREKK